MILEIVVVVLFFLIYIFYELYFKKYFEVRRVFKTLKSFLNTRDSLVLKILPDIKNKALIKEITKLIEERKLNFDSSHNNAILSDVKLNSKLKIFYDETKKINKNDVIEELLNRLVILENSLKKIRLEYNQKVLDYNNGLIKHKRVLLRIIKMKPLDIYKVY